MRAAPSTAKSMNVVGVGVELAVVAAAQQLQVAGDHAQRLGEVVRGDVGELLELGVGALELARAVLQRALGGAPRGDVARERHAADDAADVVAQRRDLDPVGRRPSRVSRSNERVSPASAARYSGARRSNASGGTTSASSRPSIACGS